MKKRSRLTRRGDFQRLLTGRRLYSGKTLVGFAAAGRTGSTRVGVTASRQIRGAVARNRARRRLREAARRALLGDGSTGLSSGISFDVVLIARPPALTLAFPAIEADLRGLVSRLGR